MFYDLLLNGKKYPPKLVVSYANLFANGEVLDRNSFHGGPNKPAFDLLEEKGFTIVKKNTMKDTYPDLQKFFTQAKTDKLTTSDYQKEYCGLKVKVSFGAGNVARIPWIAFLKEGQKVSNGIYPGVLLFKSKKLLFLTYGVSETNEPKDSWNLKGPKTIDDYFEENGLGNPERYGSSFVFSVFKTSQLDLVAINNDINKLISIYKNLKTNVVEEGENTVEEIHTAEFKPQLFISAAQTANLKLDDKVVYRLIASLLTKPFVILTGLSGSGKTKLALAFAQWMSQGVNGNGSADQYCLVPVGADWTNREPLLGFPNALDPKDYVYPDNGVLELIVRATVNPEKPYFLILDEMNLSHVERYFADFLSAMESKCSIALHSGEVTKNKLPSHIFLPNNLFIIGTVNIDETTYMFSPKVLDRASVIEFRVTYEEMDDYLNGYKLLDLSSLSSKGAGMGNDFVALASSIFVENVEFMSANLLEFFKVLKNGGAEFGYRSASEILRYASIIKKLRITWTDDDIIDTAIMQKLLPKVHGSRRKLEPHLKLLAELCLNKTALFEEMIKQYETDLTIDYTQVKYPVSFEKIMRMYKNLLSNGFTSYAEA